MKELLRKYEGNMKKYEEIRTVPIYSPWELENFRAHSLISGEGGEVWLFPSLGIPQRKDINHVNMRES